MRGIIQQFKCQNLQYRQMQSSKNTNKPKDRSEYTKNKKCEGKPNSFNFLIQSIERQKYTSQFDKQNCEANQGRYSIKTKPPLDDKSYLGNSGLVSHLGQLRESKQKENLNSNNSLIDSMIYKTKKYLSITESMLHNPLKVEEKMRKKGISTACQLIELITAVEQKQVAKKNHELSPYSSLNSTGNLVLGSNKSLSSSYHFPNGVSYFEDSANFIRKIENLEEQKLYLESLISQHERTNIKMFIKLNEGQSEEIQQYKKQLASLFEKYKQLQKIIRRQSQKSKALQLKLEQTKSSAGCGKLCELNTAQLKKKISGLQQIITEQNESLGMALDQIQSLKAKIEKYQINQSQMGRRSLQPEKILLDNKHKHMNRFSEIPSNDLAKSICSQLVNDSVASKNHFRSISTQTQPLSFHVPIKQNSQPKPDENLLRMLVAQASFLDLILRK